jgi:hypothetical protein
MLDNASNNSTCMHELKVILTDHDFDFDESENQVMYVICFFHFSWNLWPDSAIGAFPIQ